MTRAALAAIVVYVLWVSIARALVQPIAYDESWHIYFGDVSPLWKWVTEVGRDTHPPLSSFLWRPLVMIGDSPLWPRLLSIVPAAVQPLLMFGILRKLGVATTLALVGAAAFAYSHSFADLAVSIRAYSLASMFAMACCYAFLDAMPGAAAVATTPRRRPLALGLVCATCAIGTEYPAGLALAALVCGMLIVSRFDPDFTKVPFERMRRLTQWPERTFFYAGVGATLLFYAVTFGARELVNGLEWFPKEHQSLFEFVTRGLVLNLHYFSFLDLRGVPGGAWIALALVAALGGFGTLLARRRGDRVAHRRATVCFGLFVLVVALCVLGVLRKYPWGGFVRHQWVLAPLMLIVMVLLVDECTRRLRSRMLRVGIHGLVLAAAIWTSFESRATFDTGEVQPATLWQDEVEAIFPRDDAIPVCLPNAPFHGIYGAHLTRLRMRYVRQLEQWDEFEGGFPRRVILRPRYLWTVPPVPSPEFLAELREKCELIGSRCVRVYAVHFQRPDASVDVGEGLRAACEAVGMQLSERRVWLEGETYRLDW